MGDDYSRVETQEPKEVGIEEERPSTMVDDEVEYPDSLPEDEPEEPEAAAGRDEIPEYDEGAILGHLNRFADEAAYQTVGGKAAEVNRELQWLQQKLAPQSEEQLLRMSETERLAYQQGLTRRQQLQDYRDRILPMEANRLRDMNRQKANTIVQMQHGLQAKYPGYWHKILDRVRQMVDSRESGISADHLANPMTYDIVYRNIRGEEAIEKEGRSKLRKMAAGAQTVGRGVGEEGGQKNFREADGLTPRQVAERYRKMNFSEGEIKATLRRMFGD